jgi:hypothetical protein
LTPNRASLVSKIIYYPEIPFLVAADVHYIAQTIAKRRAVNARE